MCLVAAAFPQYYLDDTHINDGQGPSLLLPPRELHCLQGYAVGGFVFELGMFMIGGAWELPSAVEQLGQALGALRWFTCACLPPEEVLTFGLFGRCFRISYPDEEEDGELAGRIFQLECDCMKTARDVWGYNLGVYEMRGLARGRR